MPPKKSQRVFSNSQLTERLSQLFQKFSSLCFFPSFLIFFFLQSFVSFMRQRSGYVRLPLPKLLPSPPLNCPFSSTCLPPPHLFPLLPSDPCLLPPSIFSPPHLFLTNSFSNLSIYSPPPLFLLLPSPCYPSCCGSRRLCGLRAVQAVC